MKITLLLVLVCAALSATLPYQAHSFNDLDYLIQLLRKGTNHIYRRSYYLQDGFIDGDEKQLRKALHLEINDE